MSQHYSDPEREDDPYALPDVETFKANYVNCSECQGQALVIFSYHPAVIVRAIRVKCTHCGKANKLTVSGWFYQFCFPGCLPDSEPMGPYATEAEAVAAAQDDN
jgi:endogenous inhibitor of DNA gyrase (YacG/DUF329 family)